MGYLWILQDEFCASCHEDADETFADGGTNTTIFHPSKHLFHPPLVNLHDSSRALWSSSDKNLNQIALYFQVHASYRDNPFERIDFPRFPIWV